MEKNPICDVMSTTMEKIREMVEVNTIVGQPITVPGGITLIPVSKLSFGFASGGSDFKGKSHQPADKANFGGGGGAGVKITPAAFVVINGSSVKLISVDPPYSATPVDKILDAAPDLIEKVKGIIEKKAASKEAESTEDAPTEE